MMKKMVGALNIILLLVAFNSIIFAEGTFITSDKLTASDVQAFFKKNIDGKGFRNAMQFKEIIGVYQEGNKARVFYLWSGIEYHYGKNVDNQLGIDECVKFNDGRWFCTITTNINDTKSLLEK